MRLYNKKNYNHITVQDICNEASLQRSTFYLHFDNIDQMMRDIEDRILDELGELSSIFGKFDFTKTGSGLSIVNEDYNKMMIYLHNNKEYILPLLSPNGDPYFTKKYRDNIRKTYVDALENCKMTLGKNQDAIIDFIASGIITTTYNYLNDTSISMEDLMDIYVRFTERIPFLEKQTIMNIDNYFLK